MSDAWLEVDRERLDLGKLARAAGRLERGRPVVLPTDTNYDLACELGDTKAIETMRRLREIRESHMFTLLLADFKSLGRYAVVDNAHFRLLRSLVPGAYTFILPATKEVPSAFAHRKRRTVGLRVPDDAVAQGFLKALGGPMVSCSLKPPGEDSALDEVGGHRKWVGKVASLVVDAGRTPGGETTILDLSDASGVGVLRRGRGPVGFLEE